MGAATSRSRARKAFPYVLALFLVLMIFSSYSNTFTSPPLLDDFPSFIYEKVLYLHSVSVSSILSLSQSKFGWARFLPIVSLALNHSLGHSSLIYFHAVNLLIHLLAFFAVFWLFRQVLAAGKNRGAEVPLYEISGFFPLCVAAIWALSPVQTSAVTYIVQRMASMQALFFALSVACFIKARLLSGDKEKTCHPFLLSLRAFRFLQLPFKGKLGSPAGCPGFNRHLVFRFRLDEKSPGNVPENGLESPRGSRRGTIFIHFLRFHGGHAQTPKQIHRQGFQPGGAVAHGRKGSRMVHVASSLA